MESARIKTITVRGEKIVIYHYDLFVSLLTQWKESGMSREDIEEMLTS